MTCMIYVSVADNSAQPSESFVIEVKNYFKEQKRNNLVERNTRDISDNTSKH